MECFHPILISNPDASSNNTGSSKILVPCGKCEACIVSNSQEWRTRLEIEQRYCETCYFVTLTYDDTSLPIGKFSDSFGELHIVPYVSKRDLQLFFKRLRKRFEGSEIRYFFVSEYGPNTLRPHYHGILYNLPRFSENLTKQVIEVTKHIQKIWSLGHIKLDQVTYGRISYVTKYMSCVTDLPEWYPPPFRLISKGLGKSYIDHSELIDWHRTTLSCFYPDGKFKTRLPRYLKDKIFDDDMKCLIHDQIEEVRRDSFLRDLDKCNSLGYSNVIDYRHSMIDKHIRKFNNKLKKSRKDV